MVDEILPVDLFDIDLYNTIDFKQQEHPDINGHYDLEGYLEYWSEVMRKSIEGKWCHDYDEETGQGGWRFMTGHLWFFANVFKLKNDDKMMVHPTLRAVDWYIGYLFAETDGFSGFADDEEYTCSEVVRKLELGKDLRLEERTIFEKSKEHLYKEDGITLKKYVHCRKYLWGHFDRPMGQALHFNEKSNLLMIAGRRLGKTYHAISKLMRGYVTDGARTYDEYVNGNKRYTGALCDYGGTYTEGDFSKWDEAYDELATMGSYSVDTFENKEGDLDMMGFFWEPMTGSIKKLNTNFTNRNKERGRKAFIGKGSKMGRFSFGSGASAAVGDAPDDYLFEEVGTYPDFLGPHEKCDKATGSDYKNGTILSIGTGGNFQYVNNIKYPFYDPESIKCLKFPNLWNSISKEVACFIPYQYGKMSFYDEKGNYRKEEAFKQCLVERAEKAKFDEVVYREYTSECPMTLNDVFVPKGFSHLPKGRASEQLTKYEMKLKRSVEPLFKTGYFDWPDKTKEYVRFVEDANLKPIQNHEDIKKLDKGQGDRSGAFVMYEPKDPKGVYLTTVDPTLHKDGSSLACVIVFKISGSPGTMQFGIVGIWIGRHGDMKLDNEMGMKACLYYGGTLCPEMNVGNIVDDFIAYGHGDKLEPTPLKAIRTISPNYKSKFSYGVYKTPYLKDGFNRVTGRFLRTKVGETDIDGEIGDVLLIDVMECEMVLNDVAFYTDSGNYDSLSALDVVALVVLERGISLEYNNLNSVNYGTTGEKLSQLYIDAISFGYEEDNISSLIE